MLVDFIEKYKDIIIVDALLWIVLIVFFFYQVKKINSWAGYRTKNSMRNQETWTFSQRFFFKRWIFAIPLTFGTQLFMIESFSNRFICNVSMGVFLGYSLILLIITEKKLKKIIAKQQALESMP